MKRAEAEEWSNESCDKGMDVKEDKRGGGKMG
jgi:hypothetical protein